MAWSSAGIVSRPLRGIVTSIWHWYLTAGMCFDLRLRSRRFSSLLCRSQFVILIERIQLSQTGSWTAIGVDAVAAPCCTSPARLLRQIYKYFCWLSISASV
jgi:hypothetical protein